MIVSFFARGTGSGAGPVDYLLGRDRQREKAVLLKGDPDETAALIDSSRYSKTYTSGVLSFEEANIDDDLKRQVMSDFEECLFPGLDKDQYNVLWVEHTDKGRLELNFVIPNLELTSGKRLQPYYHGADLPRVDAWRTIQNLTHGFSDPTDPAKRQTLIKAKDLPEGKKEALEAINDGLLSLVAQGVITDRDGIVTALEGHGFEIARQTNTSISIKDPEGGRNIRLKGAIYEQNFRISEDLQADIEKRSREHKSRATSRLSEARERYKGGIERRQHELAKRHKRVAAPMEHESIQRLADRADSLVLALIGPDNREHLARDRHSSRPENAGNPERRDREYRVEPLQRGHNGEAENAGLRENRPRFSGQEMGQRGRNLHDSGAVNDRNRTPVIEYLEAARERSTRNRKEHDDRLRRLSEEGQRSGEARRASSILERAKYHADRAAFALGRIVEVVKERFRQRQKERGHGMSR